MTKSRWFSIVSYSDIYLTQKVLEHYGQYIRAYAFIIHDKDMNDKHIHLLLRTYQTYSFTAINNWFNACRNDDDNQNTFVQSIKDRQGIVDYLTHKNNEEKYQYSVDDIVDGGLDQFLITTAKDETFDILQSIIDDVDYLVLSQKYGRDFIYHFKDYFMLAEQIKLQRLRKGI